MLEDIPLIFQTGRLDIL
uniref:Uncharacterized protein n=1 Tax=Anguilla anguilla TaxID=7936 RepID=A0A0E9S6K3_ANGAN